MNLKERGFTVGDLFIVLIILAISFFVFNRSGEEGKQEAHLNNYFLINNSNKLNFFDSKIS